MKRNIDCKQEGIKIGRTIVGRFYFKILYVLYFFIIVLSAVGLFLRNYNFVSIFAFSSIVLVLVDSYYGRKRYGYLTLPLVQKDGFLYRLRNVYRIFWIKHKYLSGFIFANVCLAIFLAIDYRSMDLEKMVTIVVIFEFCVLAGVALAKGSE